MFVRVMVAEPRLGPTTTSTSGQGPSHPREPLDGLVGRGTLRSLKERGQGPPDGLVGRGSPRYLGARAATRCLSSAGSKPKERYWDLLPRDDLTDRGSSHPRESRAFPRRLGWPRLTEISLGTGRHHPAGVHRLVRLAQGRRACPAPSQAPATPINAPHARATCRKAGQTRKRAKAPLDGLVGRGTFRYLSERAAITLESTGWSGWAQGRGEVRGPAPRTTSADRGRAILEEPLA